MLKKKKGFTLVELLAVIAILGIVSVIIIPATLNTIKKAHKNTFLNSTRNLMNAVNITQKDYMFESGIEELEFQYNNGVETSNRQGLQLDYTGKNPENGIITINKNGRISFALHDGTYCAEKAFNNKEIIINEKPFNECEVPTSTFAIKFGGSGSDSFEKVIELEDGYLAVGSTNSYDGDLEDLYNFGDEFMPGAIIVRYDLEGNVIWKNNYGGDYDEGFYDVALVNDGYVAVGYSSSSTGDLENMNLGEADGIIVKYNLEGNVVWNYNFGGTKDDGFYKIKAVSDGFIVVGRSNSTDGHLTDLTNGGIDAIIVKYDLEGNVDWNKNFGGGHTDAYYSDAFNDVIAIENGYVAVGHKREANVEAVIVKYDLEGNVDWNKDFGGSSSEQFNSIKETPDGYIVVGDSYSTDGDLDTLNKGNVDAIIVKYYKNGDLDWNYNFGGTRWEQFLDVELTNDGYIAVGTGASDDGDLTGLIQPNSNDGFYKYFAIMAKYSLDGTLVSSNFYGGSEEDEFNGITKVSDGYIVYGRTFSEDFFGDYYINCFGSDAFIVKTNSKVQINLPPVGNSKVDEDYCPPPV
ncbi:MAG: type II secretion system protein [Bacilli bacterium]|nr:type II secretion system protein [Bacilli bacterium]